MDRRRSTEVTNDAFSTPHPPNIAAPETKPTRLEKALALVWSAELFRFVLVGGGGFLVDAATLLGLSAALNLDPLFGRILSFLVAMTFTWVLNRSFTFRRRKRHKGRRVWGYHREVIRYLSVSTFAAAANFALYAVTIGLLADHPIHLVLGVAIGSLSGLAINYFGYKYLVFSLPKSARD